MDTLRATLDRSSDHRPANPAVAPATAVHTYVTTNPAVAPATTDALLQPLVMTAHPFEVSVFLFIITYILKVFVLSLILILYIERTCSESEGVRPLAILILFLVIIYCFEILNALVLSPEVFDLRKFSVIIYCFDILNALVLSPEVSDLRHFCFIFS